MNPFQRPRGYGGDYSRGGMYPSDSYGSHSYQTEHVPGPLYHGSHEMNPRHQKQPLPFVPQYMAPRPFPPRGFMEGGDRRGYGRPPRLNTYRPRGRGISHSEIQRDHGKGSSDDRIASYFKPSMLEDPWKALTLKPSYFSDLEALYDSKFAVPRNS